MSTELPEKRHLGDVLVIGLGRTGEAVTRYCLRRLGGRVDSVTLYGGVSSREGALTHEFEDAGCTSILGTEEIEGHYDLAISSPGISEFSQFYLNAAEHSDEIVGEPEFAWRESPERWIGITGTNGKTTTTTLVRDLLLSGEIPAQAVGNIGILATDRLDHRVEGDWFVAELSSFQLATTHELHPRIAVLLNITPDHVAWHRTHENYIAAKEKIFHNLDECDLAVVSVDDETCRVVADELESGGIRTCRVSVKSDPGTPCAAYLRDSKLRVRLDGVDLGMVSTEELTIKGEHNVENALAASACALEAGVPAADVRRGLKAFQPLEHRIEPCGRVRGVDYINDSKATNVDATEKALTAFPSGRIVLLVGGHDKGSDLTEFVECASKSCRAVVCYGEAGPRFAEALRGSQAPVCPEIIEAAHMAEALEAASSIATHGDTVLLSPACSSFDEFENFEQRGAVFKELVTQMIGEARS